MLSSSKLFSGNHNIRNVECDCSILNAACEVFNKTSLDVYLEVLHSTFSHTGKKDVFVALQVWCSTIYRFVKVVVNFKINLLSSRLYERTQMLQ